MKEIRKIVARYDLLDHEREKCALATVVSVEQSSYRRIGARMLVTESGAYVGGISGGCLEGDALRRARAAILKGKPSVVTYDTLEDDNHQIGVGLGCNGKIEVLFAPIDSTNLRNPIEVLRGYLEIRMPKILLQVIDVETDSTKLNGFLYTEADLKGLKADYDCNDEGIQKAIQAVKSNRKSRVLSVKRTDKKGSMLVLCEFLRPAIQLVLVGDNYDIEPFFSLCSELGWNLELVGLRRKFSKAAFAAASKVYRYEELDQLTPDTYTAVVLMSHDYDKDLLALRHFLPLNPRYLGLLGPRKRMIKLHDDLGKQNLKAFPNLYAPTGLDIGAESPEEIAASITAEIIAVFRGRAGGELRKREGSIH